MPRSTTLESIAIVDNNCLRHLTTEESQKAFLGSLRSAGWEVFVTAINVLEALRSPSNSKKQQLLGILRSLAPGVPILPWPHSLLERAARAIHEGRQVFAVGPSHLEWAYAADLSSTNIPVAQRFLEDQIAHFEKLHEDGRSEIQQFLRKHGLRRKWTSIPAFLDETWMQPSHIGDFAIELWRHFGLPDPAPVDRLLSSDIWRLYFEGQGAAVFNRAVQMKRDPEVHFADYLQLPYLAGAQRRMLITNDTGFRVAANAILQGRHANAAVAAFSDIA